MAGINLKAPERKKMEGPVIFLAGPITCAFDWQTHATKYINENAPEINIVNPRRDEWPDDPDGFAIQVDWETEMLNLAGKQGCVFFWLALPAQHRCDHVYAQTTRFELGEWKSRHEGQGANVVIGIEKGFSNEDYIRHRISSDTPSIPLEDDLEKACDAAIKLAKNI